ncbi:hypothetical protein GCM10025783_03900 [Amnibacterium soli]|uniref:Uncharacterized protein n=1 Tax=Amnibacterium soli TaxID=1282736 RepID=A0ABP8YQD5_9MICO
MRGGADAEDAEGCEDDEQDGHEVFLEVRRGARSSEADVERRVGHRGRGDLEVERQRGGFEQVVRHGDRVPGGVREAPVGALTAFNLRVTV